MTGTFAGALEARGIPATEKELQSDTVGEIETEGNVLVIRRIQITYRLKLVPEKREAAERAHQIYQQNCPIARSIGGCIAITSELHLQW